MIRKRRKHLKDPLLRWPDILDSTGAAESLVRNKGPAVSQLRPLWGPELFTKPILCPAWNLGMLGNILKSLGKASSHGLIWSKEGGCECYIKQNCFIDFLCTQWTNRCLLSSKPYWWSHQATKARWPLLVHCMLRKLLKKRKQVRITFPASLLCPMHLSLKTNCSFNLGFFHERKGGRFRSSPKVLGYFLCINSFGI